MVTIISENTDTRIAVTKFLRAILKPSASPLSVKLSSNSPESYQSLYSAYFYFLILPEVHLICHLREVLTFHSCIFLSNVFIGLVALHCQ